MFTAKVSFGRMDGTCPWPTVKVQVHTASQRKAPSLQCELKSHANSTKLSGDMS